MSGLSLVKAIFKKISGSLLGLFSQIKNGGEEVRDRAIKFLHLKMKTGKPKKRIKVKTSIDLFILAGPDLIPNDAHGILFEQISDIIEVIKF